MGERRLGIILNGATGRIGVNQHLSRAVVPLRNDGIPLADGTVVRLDPILVGRNADKTRRIAERFGIERWTTDLDTALSDPKDTLFFDSAITNLRVANVRRALDAGKDVFCDKPLGERHADALALADQAERAGLHNGVTMTHLWLPGLRKLKLLTDSGFFGKVLTIKGEHGYWVFAGDGRPGQRPAWNNRREDGGGIVLDMMCHWHYLLETLFGPVRRVTCTARTFIPRRWDETGQPYDATADDTAFVLCEMESGALVQIHLAWTTRVRRDDLMLMQVDGTNGSAVVGIFDCLTQHAAQTPSVVWNAEDRVPTDHRAAWLPVADLPPVGNAFKHHWEKFIRHLHGEGDFPWNFRMAAKGIRMVEKCYRASERGTWEGMGEG